MKKFLLILVFGLIVSPNIAGAIYDPNAPIPSGDDMTPTLMLASTEVVPISASPESTSYHDPVSKETVQIDTAKDAFRVMQDYSLGINQASYDKFEKSVPTHLEGRILINIEDLGKAYLVDTKNDKLHYLGRPLDAWRVFADYNSSDLVGKTWTWQETVMNNDDVIKPKQTGAFSIIFKNDNSFNGTTDCNNYFGQADVSQNKISFGSIGATRMFCEGSEEIEFHKTLGEVESYLIDGQGRLVFTLKLDSGSMIFE